MNRSRLLLCAAALVAAACQDRQSPTAAPSFLIRDAIHNGGNPHFYWLPPMTRQLSFTGTFDGALAPLVEISELGGVTGCSNHVVTTFTTTTGPGSETVRVDPAGQLYIVNWHTKAFNLNSACTYRIRFLVAGLELGLADVDVVDNGAQLKRVDTDEFVALLDDGTLPIKARVELGAVTFAVTGDATACRPGRDCGEAVVTPVPGQDATVLTTGQTAGLFIPAAALREQIIVLIESRSDRPCIPRSSMALPQFDDCYRYVVNPTASIERPSVRQATEGEINTSYSFGDGNDATLADNVIVGMCVEVGNLTAAQAARLDIFRFEPPAGPVNTIRDASAAFLPCDPNFGAPPPVGASGVLHLGWRLVMHGLHSLLGTRTAYASTSVIHLGLGGSTCCTSYFTWGVPGVLFPNLPDTTFVVPVGSTVLPSVVVKDSGGSPMAGAMVRFAATSGTIIGTNPVTTGTDGIAQVSWQVPSAAGTFILTANVPGAAQSPRHFLATVTVPVTVDAGGFHSCALNASGQAFCWGSNSFGQLGDGTTTEQLVPTAVAGGATFAALSAGGSISYEHTCGVTTSGAAFCWGGNGVGQLGDGTTTQRLMPRAVSGPLTFASLSAGAFHTCGATTSGAAYCWGLNGDGQLGDGTTTQQLVPTAVAGEHTFAAVSAGAVHTCGVTTSGAAFCWGANDVGQLGDGTTTQRLIPALVAGGLSFAAVSTGFDHTCGVTTSGAAYCWGYSGNGRLGNGTTSGPELCPFGNPCSTVPTPVADGLTFATLSAYGAHTCGVTSASGAAYCWGLNAGALGDGTTTQRLVPTAVAEGISFAAVSAGQVHTCGVTTSGAAYCWGRNVEGELGDGTTTIRLVPTAVAFAGNGAVVVRLTTSAGSDFNPAWSPDGAKIAFVSSRDDPDGEIYLMNADGTGVVRLTTSASSDGQPAWSPDGAKIAFGSTRDGDSEIYVMNADGTGVVRLTTSAGSDGQPTWSPDGAKIAFRSTRDGDLEIYVMNADGAGVVRLTTSAGFDGEPAWSPDGAKIAFVSVRDGGAAIYVMNADGTGVVRLTPSAGDDVFPAWSPDGAKIAFTAFRGDADGEIYVMNADGTGVVRLTTSPGDDFDPAWSPDGAKIAFASTRDDPDGEIYVMRVAGAGPAQLTTQRTAERSPR